MLLRSLGIIYSGRLPLSLGHLGHWACSVVVSTPDLGVKGGSSNPLRSRLLGRVFRPPRLLTQPVMLASLGLIGPTLEVVSVGPFERRGWALS